MVRKAIQQYLIGRDTGFRFRGENAFRIEAFNDGIFALALTLLLISARSPDTLQELFAFTHEFLT